MDHPLLNTSSFVTHGDYLSAAKYQEKIYSERTGVCVARSLNYPLKRSLKELLNNYSVSKNQTTRLPSTVEEFLKLPAIVRKHYWFHKPDVRGMLHRAGIADLSEVL